jgi:hypothetical protein
VENQAAAAQHHVGNKLLERRIVLRCGARQEAHLRRVEQARQVVNDVGSEALKKAGVVEDRRGNDEDEFFSGSRHAIPSMKSLGRDRLLLDLLIEFFQ